MGIQSTQALICQTTIFEPFTNFFSTRKELIKKLDFYRYKIHKCRFLLLGILAFVLISSFPSSAHAFLFNKLQDTVEDIIVDAGSSITGQDIEDFFNIIRVGVIFIFIVGILYTLVQMYMQSNWVLPLLLITGFVLAILAIEFFSNLVLPDNTSSNNLSPTVTPLVRP